MVRSSSATKVEHGPSSRQTVPALEPACLEDGTTRPCGHPMPKAVALGPLSIVRLVGPFHLGAAFLEAVLEVGRAAVTTIAALEIVGTQCCAAVSTDGARTGHGRRRADRNGRGKTRRSATSPTSVEQETVEISPEIHPRTPVDRVLRCPGHKRTRGCGVARTGRVAVRRSRRRGAIGTMRPVGEAPGAAFSTECGRHCGIEETPGG
jgi:hypothetical protein